MFSRSSAKFEGVYDLIHIKISCDIV